MGCFICVKTHFLFYVSKGHCFERKAKITFLKDCFDIWMVLAFIFCGFWYYLYIVAKTSSSFSGFWHSNLFGTLRSKLGTMFWKYLLKVSTISEWLGRRFAFSIRDIFSKLLDLSMKKLLTVLKNFSWSTTFYVFLVFFNKLMHLFLCLLYAFLPLLDFKEFFS